MKTSKNIKLNILLLALISTTQLFASQVSLPSVADAKDDRDYYQSCVESNRSSDMSDEQEESIESRCSDAAARYFPSDDAQR